MIVVTTKHTAIAIDVIEGSVFDPDQAAVLKLAYDRACAALSGEFHMTQQAKLKLAKIVLRTGRLSLASGHSLSSQFDVQDIASIASVHLLASGAKPDQETPMPPLLFQVASNASVPGSSSQSSLYPLGNAQSIKRSPA
jgi:hypothetical protein